MAVALAEELDCFETVEGAPGPLPDVAEIDGVVYSSRPVAVRAEGDGYVLERRRETVTAAGRLTIERNLIHLDGLQAGTLEDEATRAGLRPIDRVSIAATEDYVGTTVVMLRV
jgi:hypothetical protein